MQATRPELFTWSCATLCVVSWFAFYPALRAVDPQLAVMAIFLRNPARIQPRGLDLAGRTPEEVLRSARSGLTDGRLSAAPRPR